MSEQIFEITADGRCFRLDLQRKALFKDRDKLVHLTPRQFELLTYMVQQPSRALLGQNDLIRNVWPLSEYHKAQSGAVYQAVKSLREVLGEEGMPFLKIVRGQGFRIDAEIRRLQSPDTFPLSSDESGDQKTADTLKLTPGERIARISPRSPEEAMAFLLFIDQFPVGIWGASLESAADLWGHKNDPGSITISTRACIGLTGATGSVSLPPITAYESIYVHEEANPERLECSGTSEAQRYLIRMFRSTRGIPLRPFNSFTIMME
jgi:DNA-binding winged helix-turn-helix (wHTH) protein